MEREITQPKGPALLVEITPEMIAAGLEEMREHRLGDDPAYVLESVFRAMAYASPFASSMRPLK